jgi:hypothetical protein
MAKNPKGLVMYKGPSMLDDVEVALIVTFTSVNRKTGNLLQTWIVETGKNPVEANHSQATCGACPMKPMCYVNSGQAPYSIWQALQRGIYPSYEPSHNKLFLGRLLRMGSDGDPRAIPDYVWRLLQGLTIKSVGYTHQWSEPSEFWPFNIMASVESEGQKERANALGYKTFRVVEDYSEKLWDEIICLADSKGKTCANCMLCTGRHTNVVIKAHGSKSKKFKSIGVVA